MLDAMPIDFREDSPKVTATDLALISIKARELLAQKLKVERLENDLSSAKERFRELETKELPEAMAAASSKRFDLDKASGGGNAYSIQIKDIISGSPGKENFEYKLSWLREHDHGGIIKSSVYFEILLAKGQESDADKIGKILEEFVKTHEFLKKFPGKLSTEPTIHFQTFGKWCRELHEQHTSRHLPNSEDFQDYEYEEHKEHGTTRVNDCEMCDCPFCSEDIVKFLGIYVGKKAEILKIP